MTGRPTQCDIEVRVRYAEVDQMGMLHHSQYWVYFEMGRTELLRRGGYSYRDCQRDGVFFVLARCAAKFHAPARYDDLLVLTTRITRVGLARIDHAYELKLKNPDAGRPRLLATAQTTLACVDADGKVIPMPETITGQPRTRRKPGSKPKKPTKKTAN